MGEILNDIMAKKSFIIKTLTAPVVFFLFASTVSGSKPQIRTPLPVIYLEDNLDEKDDHGYCIDTVGRGFAKNYMHIHVNPVGVMSSSNTIMMKKGYNLRLSKVNAQR